MYIEQHKARKEKKKESEQNERAMTKARKDR
jgi:hypothetical protein